MPMPKRTVDVCLQTRDKANRFVTSSTVRFDPATFHPAKRLPEKEPVKLLYNGDPHQKIDVFLSGDPFTHDPDVIRRFFFLSHD